MREDFDRLVAYLRNGPGQVKSDNVRLTEDPPSADFHIVLDGKEYVVNVQPTDMQDRP